ncbi:hypothetical protein [Paenibacillus harenae]|uniref:hypothetical protein n=1 Tax=Paenibacillus harenae TaxID=306543 RepID=UPI0004184915|nr:hypothetical protein [Paenibacillus harenae]
MRLWIEVWRKDNEEQYYGLDRDEVNGIINHYENALYEIEELRKALEWANRIIGSGLDNGSQLLYDPIAWNIKYHTEWKEQTT